MSGEASSDDYSGWRTARQSYAFLFSHMGEAFKAFGFWLFLATLVSVGFWPIFLSLSGGAMHDTRIVGWTFLALLLILLLVAHTAMAVVWQRRVLLREPVSPLRLSPYRRLLRAMPFIVGLTIVQQIIPLLWRTAVSLATPYSFGTFVGTLVWSTIAVYLWVRMAVRWAALATDDQTMTRRHTWSIADRHGWSLFSGMLAVSAPLVLLTMLLTIILRQPSTIGYAVTTLLYYLLSMTGVLLNATFFALSYRALAGREAISSVFD